MPNEEWYDKFNTRCDVAKAIGVTRNHKVLLNHTAKEKYKKDYVTLTPDEAKDTIEMSEKEYLSHIFLRQSGKQHNKLRQDLRNEYTTGNDWNPKNRQEVLHLLDKYSKSAVIASTANEGSSFAQRGGEANGANTGGGRGDGRFGKSYDVQYWKAKQCYNCNKKGHPSSHCPDKKTQAKPKSNDDDNKSVSSKNSKASIAKLQKDFKKTKKSFTTLQSKIQEL